MTRQRRDKESSLLEVISAWTAGSAFTFPGWKVHQLRLATDQPPRVLAIGWNPQPDWLQPCSAASERPKYEGHVVGEQNA